MKLTWVVMIACLVVCAATENFVCERNVQYIENECNICFCTGNNNDLGCGDKACLDARFIKLVTCKVGTTSTKACNKCWCVKDYGTICTNKKC